MSPAILKAQIAHAKARAAIGDCASAEQILNAAWSDLVGFSQALAHRGASPAAALSMHRLLAKAQAAVRKKCPGELLPATYRSRGAPADLIAPTFAPARNPDLLAPSFSGPETTVAWGAGILALFSLGVIALGVGKLR